MRLPECAWDLTREYLLRYCRRCGHLAARDDPCAEAQHCRRCCDRTAPCLPRLLARQNHGRLWRWTLGQCAFCLRCGHDSGRDDLHWVHDGEGEWGYGAVCPRCGAGEESLVPVPPPTAQVDRRAMFDRWSAVVARRPDLPPPPPWYV